MPECRLNVSNSAVRAGDLIQLQCVVNYTRTAWIPQFQCFQRQTRISATQGNRLIHTVALSACLHTHTHTHTHLTALCPGPPGCVGTRKVKPIWILLEQETVSGSGISWAICKSAPCSRQTTMPAPHHSVFFTGRMPFLLPNQQRQSTEGFIYAY